MFSGGHPGSDARLPGFEGHVGGAAPPPVLPVGQRAAATYADDAGHGGQDAAGTRQGGPGGRHSRTGACLLPPFPPWRAPMFEVYSVAHLNMAEFFWGTVGQCSDLGAALGWRQSIKMLPLPVRVRQASDNFALICPWD